MLRSSWQLARNLDSNACPAPLRRNVRQAQGQEHQVADLLLVRVENRQRVSLLVVPSHRRRGWSRRIDWQVGRHLDGPSALYPLGLAAMANGVAV